MRNSRSGRAEKWRALAYLGQAIAVVAIVWGGMGFNRENVRVPVSFFYDGLQHALVARSITESGGWKKIARISYPTGADLTYFPFEGRVDAAFEEALAWGTHDFGSVANLFWLLSMAFAAVISAWCLRLLGCEQWTALALGCLYGLLPRAFAKNTQFLMLVYYLVPIPCTLAITALRGTFGALKKWERALLYAGCAAIGLEYVYTAFFACFVLAVAAGVRCFSHGADKSFRVIVQALACVCVAAVLVLAPTSLALKHDLVAKANLDQKELYQAELFGMEIRQLVLPISGHPLGAFNAVAEKSQNAHFPLEFENADERLGTVGSLGFLYLLAVALLAAFKKTGAKASRPEGVFEKSREAAVLTMALFLLSTVGGLGALFNLLVTPDIRCYARSAVFIAFFALVPVGVLLSGAEKRFARNSFTVLFAVLMGAFVFLGVRDQVSFAAIRKIHEYSMGRYEAEKAFVTGLEASLPAATPIYQLPYVEEPNAPMHGEMGPHQEAIGYLFSKSLRWSWGALSGQALTLDRELAALPPEKLVVALGRLGYGGIWIDCDAYKDRGKAEVQGLGQLLKSTPIESPDGNIAFFRLPAAAQQGERR